MQGDTISAIATAQGEGGIGIIRLSGGEALAVADKMFRPASGKSILDYPSHRAVYGTVVDEEGRTVDETMAIIMKAPSETALQKSKRLIIKVITASIWICLCVITTEPSKTVHLWPTR